MAALSAVMAAVAAVQVALRRPERELAALRAPVAWQPVQRAAAAAMVRAAVRAAQAALAGSWWLAQAVLVALVVRRPVVPAAWSALRAAARAACLAQQLVHAAVMAVRPERPVAARVPQAVLAALLALAAWQGQPAALLPVLRRQRRLPLAALHQAAARAPAIPLRTAPAVPNR